MKDKEKCSNTQEFLRCSVCGNIIVKLEDSGVTPQCCGRDMEPIEPNTVDASTEAHVPCWKVNGHKLVVHIGEKDHPMEDVHSIQWVFVKTDKGCHTVFLCPEDEPEVCIKLHHNECVDAIYCYCNKHGLWKAACEKDMKDDKNHESGDE